MKKIKYLAAGLMLTGMLSTAAVQYMPVLAEETAETTAVPVPETEKPAEAEVQKVRDLSKIVYNGKYYYAYNAAGKRYSVKRPKIVKVQDNYYCVYDKRGRVKVREWFLLKGKLYKAGKDGRLAVNRTVDGIPFDEKGVAKNCLETKLKKKCMGIAKQKNYDLKACFRYVAYDGFKYAVKYPKIKKGWTRKTAYDMLMTKKGNCYSFACAFAALARECGYKPLVVCGRVRGTRDHARDGYTRHCWVTIKGRFYDPEGEHAGFTRGHYGDYTTNLFGGPVQSIWKF